MSGQSSALAIRHMLFSSDERRFTSAALFMERLVSVSEG